MPPLVYVFHGDDEFGIAVELNNIKTKLGKDGPVDMNFIVLEPGSFSLDELEAMVMTIPFLARRRAVVLNDALKQFDARDSRDRFLDILGRVPDATAVVVVEKTELPPNHWLLKWAGGNPARVYVRRFGQQTGSEMAIWIQGQAQAQGGEVSWEAANALAQLTGSQKRHASQEIEKLIAFAGYERPVSLEDVQLLSTGVDEEALSMVFEMVDSIGKRRTEEAIKLLQQLLRVYEPVYLFYMIVRQFRLLILAREVLDSGRGGSELARQMKLKPFIISKMTSQAQNFNLNNLEEIYRFLLKLDTETKTGQIDIHLALDTFVAGLIPLPSAD